MKKFERLFIVFFIVTPVVFYSCSDKFLDITNENELSADNFFEKIDGFDQALSGAYDAVKNIDLFGQYFYTENLLSLSHEADYWNAQCKNEVTSSDGFVLQTWRGLYKIVARANDVLDNEQKFLAENRTDAEKKQMNLIIGQAHFLRGLAYFHLVRLWGEDSYKSDSSKLAVPLLLKVPGGLSDLQNPRASVGKVYNQIVADFKIAETNLKDVVWDENNIARISPEAVTAFLGQVYLYMEDYQNARTYFEMIINNSKYSLVPSSKYKDLFNGKNEFSSESLWELNYAVDMQKNQWEGGLGSGIALIIAPSGRGYSNFTPHAVNIDRFGSDPRLEICTYKPTDELADCNGGVSPAGASQFNLTGHYFRKYVPEDYCIYNTNRNSGINFHMMRLADVYLMYAEVMNKLSDNTTALEFTNKVRRRAYGFNANTPEVSVDFTTALNPIQVRDSIREERFRELFAEGHRWYDIVRWKIVEEEVLKYNDRRKTQGLILYQPKDYYYPVPLLEIDTNKKLVPSTGY